MPGEIEIRITVVIPAGWVKRQQLYFDRKIMILEVWKIIIYLDWHIRQKPNSKHPGDVVILQKRGTTVVKAGTSMKK